MEWGAFVTFNVISKICDTNIWYNFMNELDVYLRRIKKIKKGWNIYFFMCQGYIKEKLERKKYAHTLHTHFPISVFQMKKCGGGVCRAVPGLACPQIPWSVCLDWSIAWRPKGQANLKLLFIGGYPWLRPGLLNTHMVKRWGRLWPILWGQYFRDYTKLTTTTVCLISACFKESDKI